MEDLREMTWNSEGFRDPGKHLFVKESIQEYRLDFIALLEQEGLVLIYLLCEILRAAMSSHGFVYHLRVGPAEYWSV
jgi:hypothetical protein